MKTSQHRSPFWQATFQTALGALVAAGAASLPKGDADNQPPRDAPSNALAHGDLGALADPVEDWADEEPHLSFQDLLVEEAAQIADAAVAMLGRRDEEVRPEQKPVAHYEESHSAGRQPVSAIGRVPVLGPRRG